MGNGYAAPDAATRIKALRARYDLTQAQLGDVLGVAQGAVSRWERGIASPPGKVWGSITRIERDGLEAFAGDQGRASVGRMAGSAAVVHEGVSTHAASDGAAPAPAPAPFTAAPEEVRLAVEAHRLEYGYLVNPAFATEVSQIEPLPHQRIAVYERMLPESRLRFLLADDAGAGKTIMTGLYIREMFARRMVRRVLIVPPAGLVGNWRRELETLFSLSFRIVSGVDARGGANPFIGPDSDLLIVSVDTLAGEWMFGCLQDANVAPYDLVIFDEAHKLSADREADLSLRRTDRHRLGEALAGVPVESDDWWLEWSARHLLLLTATPHMGKDFPYYALWRLLEAADGEGRATPLIDRAHRLMQLWRAGEVASVDDYLDAHGLRRSPLFHHLLQALIELSTVGSEERSLLESISNHVNANVATVRKAEATLWDGVGEE